ncbi:MAG: ferritin-like domain-containing protein [Acidobacteria bacterium]|nr:ferritin-like domain-containing protein [Acidobacteriota bacterium]
MRNKINLVDIARRDLLKMAAMTGTVGIITALGESLNPTLAAVASLPQKKKGAPTPAKEPEAKLTPALNDVGIANMAIQLEQRAINTYLGLKKEKILVNKNLLDVTQQFSDDHVAHRDALVKAVKALGGEPANYKGLGTFPIPATILKKESEAVRYGMALELIASKVYFDAFKDKLKTPEGRNLIINILSVETQHVGVLRTVLKFVVDKSNKSNKILPYPTLEEEPMPEMPKGFSWDFNA